MRRPERSRFAEPVPDVTNPALALAALDHLGGAERYIDIEDVAIEAHGLAADRFSWRTRREFPSLERVRTAFVHANQTEQRRGGPPLVISNRDGSSWKLTAEGIALARSNSARIQAATGRAAPARRTGRTSERVRQIRRHPAFGAFTHGTPVADIPRHELADLLICPPDSPADAVIRKVSAAKAAAVDVDDIEVKEFLDQVAGEIGRKWS